MKKTVFRLCFLCSCLVLWSCNQRPNLEDTGTGATVTGRTAVDTSTASSAPVMEDQDSTLQEIQEISLRATGNTLDEIAYSEDTLEVRAGAHIKLTFINEGVDMPMMHNVVFTAPGAYRQVAVVGSKIGASGNYVPNDSAVIAASPMALPGQTVEMDFTAPSKPGTYQFVCTYPDHWRRMHGVLIVK